MNKTESMILLMECRPMWAHQKNHYISTSFTQVHVYIPFSLQLALTMSFAPSFSHLLPPPSPSFWTHPGRLPANGWLGAKGSLCQQRHKARRLLYSHILEKRAHVENSGPVKAVSDVPWSSRIH